MSPELPTELHAVVSAVGSETPEDLGVSSDDLRAGSHPGWPLHAVVGNRGLAVVASARVEFCRAAKQRRQTRIEARLIALHTVLRVVTHMSQGQENADATLRLGLSLGLSLGLIDDFLVGRVYEKPPIQQNCVLPPGKHGAKAGSLLAMMMMVVMVVVMVMVMMMAGSVRFRVSEATCFTNRKSVFDSTLLSRFISVNPANHTAVGRGFERTGLPHYGTWLAIADCGHC